MYSSPLWREDDATIVDDPLVIDLACQATGVYDKADWYSDEIPDHVWEEAEQERADRECE